MKRCCAMARRQPWEVWEEDILWWSPDRQRWQPLEAESLPRRRRWLLVETVEGLAAALIWEAGDGLALPAATPQAATWASALPPWRGCGSWRSWVR